MHQVAVIVFWFSVFCILMSYLFYPALLRLFSFFRKCKIVCESVPFPELPMVSVLMAVYNEELVIEKKIRSVFASTYPQNKLEVFVGSDKSGDKTNQILENLQKEFPNLFFINFTERQGKKNIINQLIDKSKGEILISTDANVLFTENTIVELVKCFVDPSVGLADSNMKHHGLVSNGISIQESAYISREVGIKNLEGQLWGTMMGPFGGCFAIRKTAYTKVPANHLMDDFYVNMKVLEKGYKSVNNLDSHVYEDVSNQFAEEFKRKIRIAAGNFQNLAAFYPLLNPFAKRGNISSLALSFCFLMHKVLRWFGPFFLIFIGITGLILFSSPLYKILTILYLVSFLMVGFDFTFKKYNVHVTYLRFASHFYGMNLALLLGLVKYFKGVKTNVWQPTKRNQSNV